MNNDIRRIAACVSENLCVQNGVIYEAENPVSLAELGMEDEGDDLGTKLASLGFERVQKTPEIMGFGMKMSDGRYLVIWDSENPGEGQWSVVAGSEVQPAEESGLPDMTPEQQELESEYTADAEWDAKTMDDRDNAEQASQAPRATSPGI
jgi:hypothetical protein